MSRVFQTNLLKFRVKPVPTRSLRLGLSRICSSRPTLSRSSASVAYLHPSSSHPSSLIHPCPSPSLPLCPWPLPWFGRSRHKSWKDICSTRDSWELTFPLCPMACGLRHCSVTCHFLPCTVFFTEFKWHHLPCHKCPSSRIPVLVNFPNRVNEWGVYFLTTTSSSCKYEVPYCLRMCLFFPF